MARAAQGPAVQFRDRAVESELAARVGGPAPSPGLVAARDLARYYGLLARELGALGLSESEALAVCDATNGTLWDAASIPLVWASVDDAIRLSGLAERHGIDGPALVAKLRDATLGQRFALVDAAERFWTAPDSTDPRETVRAVGLVRERPIGEP